MSAASVLVQVLEEALPAAVELASRALAGEDVEADAQQLAANTAYKLTSQQVHLAHAEQVIPGFKKGPPP